MFIETNYANCYLDYGRLTRVTEGGPAYRTSIRNDIKNRYPIENRNHVHKMFIPEDLNGERVYHIYYGVSYRVEERIGEPNKEERNMWTKDNSKEGLIADRYWKYKRTPNKVGIVYPDNSFEFTADGGLGQGLRQMFSGGWFSNSTWVSTEVNRGGAVMYTGSWEPKHENGVYSRVWSIHNWHPIFKGLRINIKDNTVHHSCNYEVRTYKSIRSETKKLFDEYRTDLETAKLIINSMGKDNFLEDVKEAYTTGNYTIEDTYNDTIHGNFKSPVEMLTALCIAYAHKYRGNLLHVARSDDRGWYYNSLDINAIMTRVIEVFKEDLIFTNKTIAMEEVVHKVGVRYPSTKWGVIVSCNGNIVSQYTN